MEKKVIVITGVLGLVGSASAVHFSELGYRIIGIDNHFRSIFFGPDAKQNITSESALSKLRDFVFIEEDIRNQAAIEKIFSNESKNLAAIIHCAAQPSHDWAAKDPMTDFTINANGTLVLLEAARKFAKEASFVFLSTNKVYGDKPNDLLYSEDELRWSPLDLEVKSNGFDENLGLDATTHSVFGVSKTAADLMVQEYGRYFELNTVCLRGGCLTGPLHAGAELHGFLSYLVKCAVTQRHYSIFGYKGKQVRDNIHTQDLVRAIQHYVDDPEPAQVYNIGGGVGNTISILEAMAFLEMIDSRFKVDYSVESDHRIGDHIWYASDLRKFQKRYPKWSPTVEIGSILETMASAELDRNGLGN
jgi:CDP-paratose 2-epimerase